MNLFLDTLSPQNTIILFDNQRNIIQKYDFCILWNETTKLIEEFDMFLYNNNMEYSDLENIVVVNGPGSFTGVRTTVLMINTINFVIQKNITSLNYFDLFSDYPIIKTSSKKDSFIKEKKESDIMIMENIKICDFLKKRSIHVVYGDIKWLYEIEMIQQVDYKSIIKNLVFTHKTSISPFYCKKPNIC